VYVPTASPVGATPIVRVDGVLLALSEVVSQLGLPVDSVKATDGVLVRLYWTDAGTVPPI
jgi:hypothetical protein